MNFEILNIFQPKSEAPKATSPDKFTFGQGENEIVEKRNKLNVELKEQYLQFSTQVCNLRLSTRLLTRLF